MPKRRITDTLEMEAIIGKAVYCHIGLVDSGEPYVVPVFFGYEKNAIYFHSSPDGRKVDIMRKGNRVCFQVEADVEIVRAEKACDFTTKYRSVMGTGKATILESDADKVHGLDIIMRHYARGEFTYPKATLDRTLVVRIDIDSMAGKALNY